MKPKSLNLIVLVFFLSACVSRESTQAGQDKQTAAAYNLQLGIEYFRQGNLTQAKEKLDRSLLQDPNSAQGHAAAGLLYERLNDISKADQHYSRAVDLEPENGDVTNTYAVFLCRRGERTKGEKLALKAATNALYKTPEAAWFNAGMCVLDAGNASAAESYFRKSLAVNAKFPSALLQLALLKYKSKDALQARGLLERFHSVTQATAESLLLGMRVEHDLGNSFAASEYARRLTSEFPLATQTRDLLESESKK